MNLIQIYKEHVYLRNTYLEVPLFYTVGLYKII